MHCFQDDEDSSDDEEDSDEEEETPKKVRYKLLFKNDDMAYIELYININFCVFIF